MNSFFFCSSSFGAFGLRWFGMSWTYLIPCLAQNSMACSKFKFRRVHVCMPSFTSKFSAARTVGEGSTAATRHPIARRSRLDNCIIDFPLFNGFSLRGQALKPISVPINAQFRYLHFEPYAAKIVPVSFSAYASEFVSSWFYLD